MVSASLPFTTLTSRFITPASQVGNLYSFRTPTATAPFQDSILPKQLQALIDELESVIKVITSLTERRDNIRALSDSLSALTSPLSAFRNQDLTGLTRLMSTATAPAFDIERNKLKIALGKAADIESALFLNQTNVSQSIAALNAIFDDTNPLIRTAARYHYFDGLAVNDPLNRPDLRLRFDANDVSSVDQVGIFARRFVDISGRGTDHTTNTAPANRRPEVVENAINGARALSFDGNNDRLVLPNSPDINTRQLAGQTLVIGFQTRHDITRRQVIWEQGGTVNGLNVYIENGELNVGAWRQLNLAAPPWTPDILNRGTAIRENTAYVMTVRFDRLNEAGDPPTVGLTLRLDGKEIGRNTGNNVAGARPLPAHSGAIGLGATAANTVFEDGSVGRNDPFFGLISDVVLIDDSLPNADILSMERFLMHKLGIQPDPHADIAEARAILSDVTDTLAVEITQLAAQSALLDQEIETLQKFVDKARGGLLFTDGQPLYALSLQLGNPQVFGNFAGPGLLRDFIG